MYQVDLLPLLASAVGLFLAGAIGAWLIAGRDRMSASEVRSSYVHTDVLAVEKARSAQLEEQLGSSNRELLELTESYAVARRDKEHLEQRLSREREDLLALRQHFETQFQLVANKLLEEKSERFTKRNHEEIERVLAPMRQHIKDFEENVVRRYREEQRERGALNQQIQQLAELNKGLSRDAHALTTALKGDTKMQGDWGELRLELILEKAGLVHNVHYSKQSSFRDEHNRQKRPDVVVNLPNDKHLVIDSKVSLSAYERFYQATEEESKKQYLREHIKSLRTHIRDLSGKEYQRLEQLNTPEYLLLFIPIEPAFTLAMQADNQLFVDALDKNIVLVTSSTLLATMRTVSFIWTQDNQRKNVEEIAVKSGEMYNKLCAFVEDLQQIGKRLEQASDSYQRAFTKLKSPSRFGGSILGKAEEVRRLGAKSSRRLPDNLLAEEE